MLIGICGVGFVGGAVKAGFERPGNELYLVDPKLNNGNTLAGLCERKPAAIFVAVPTPESISGEIDFSIVRKVVAEINNHADGELVVIKSTATPDHLLKLQHDCPNIHLVFNPEFLTERNAIHDFLHPQMHIIGGDEFDAEFLERLYLKFSNCEPAQVFKTDIATASLVKYAINSFLSTKVLFMNQMFDIFNRSGAEDTWEHYTKMICSDTRIGTSHMKVPGLDGLRGFGGTCFPKDTAALAFFARKLGVPFTSLEEVIKVNKELRKDA
jgi:nucleotide sugar dehydrogenase